MSLCRFRHVFGAEGTGVHAVRVMGVAAVDAVATIVAGLVLAWAFGWNPWYTCGALFLAGIVVHRMFCVNTTLNKAIFGVVP